ncbi:DAK2 domain-containing protein [Paenibacillus turpanensis]|uniref:DAK2 domain-containing protein n=1 Tax=Paenibacillus turpanensis TaxID=2689078 RepID=UPI00140D1F45|nr:DAK2 domain-containing protein [Paenibacillus turpanensis]
MSKRLINGNDFMSMVFSGADLLHRNVDNVNALNVFPVPDGDTGTNMNLTLTSGVEALRSKAAGGEIGKATEILAKGLLMGARGNSGVILSQLFRGFAKGVAGQKEIDSVQFAAGLQQGVETAYAAVVRPVEGTILTVAKEAAKHAVTVARRITDLPELMDEVLKAARHALARTPEQLPVLKQVGVVDSGGQGLVYIYEGFAAVLRGGAAPDLTGQTAQQPKGGLIDHTPTPLMKEAYDQKVPGAQAGTAPLAEEAHRMQEPKRAQAMLATEDIEFGYCTEFMIKLNPDKTPGLTFDERKFRDTLEEHGDSLLVVSDDELVKVHIHAEYPGQVMNLAMQFGDLTKIKIENMREQHTHILEIDHSDAAYSGTVADEPEQEEPAYLKPFGMVAVAPGDGIAEIFTSLGVDVVISGGQTMNPSTEDIVKAIEQVDAETVFVMPNNSNIVLAAQQAKDIVEKGVEVIPTKTVPQGMAAILAFQDSAPAEQNAETMKEAAAAIRSGQVTHAVRDSSMDGMEIKAGDFLGISESKIVSSDPDLYSVCISVLDSMIENGDEIVTVLTGEDAEQEMTARIAEHVSTTYPNAEIEIHRGGQPIYYYIFSVE